MFKASVRLASFALIAVAASAHAGVTFSNISYTGSTTTSGTLVTGASVTTLGNSLTLATPNARVGIGASTGVVDGSITLQYDATVTSGIGGWLGWSVDTVIQGFLAGSGTLYFQEDVIELDSQGNEVGVIGHVSKNWSSLSPQSVWSGNIQFSKTASSFRVKKFFYLDASTDTPGLDRSVLGQVNQSVGVVPEPASMMALGAGILAFARKRRQK